MPIPIWRLAGRPPPTTDSGKKSFRMGATKCLPSAPSPTALIVSRDEMPTAMFKMRTNPFGAGLPAFPEPGLVCESQVESLPCSGLIFWLELEATAEIPHGNSPIDAGNSHLGHDVSRRSFVSGQATVCRIFCGGWSRRHQTLRCVVSPLPFPPPLHLMVGELSTYWACLRVFDSGEL